jgi:hypothetical protein
MAVAEALATNLATVWAMDMAEASTSASATTLVRAAEAGQSNGVGCSRNCYSALLKKNGKFEGDRV